MSNYERVYGMGGTKALGIYIDEVRDYNQHYGFDPVKQEPIFEIPPYDLDADLRPYDEIVIVAGDQMGWRGRVVEVQRLRSGHVVTCDMVRPDGTKASRVSHRKEFVGKVLDKVPDFQDPETAEAWLDSQLRTPVQEYATGARVVFSCPPHMAMRLSIRRETEDGRIQREWLERFNDLEAEGRVTKFMPFWEAEDAKPSGVFGQLASRKTTIAGYELLVLLDGEPDLIEVAARRIKRLA